MNTPTHFFLSALPNNSPIGLWKVLGTIAERMPAEQLIWLAVIVCVSGLGFAAIACFGFSHVASKPATALAGFIKQHTVEKPANAP